MNQIAERHHPEPEVLASFIDGGLRGAELNGVTEHLRECDDCREVIGETARFVREESGSAPTLHERPSRWWLAAAAVVALVVAGLALRDRYSDPLRLLQPDTTRSIQARLTAFDYAPYHVTRSGETNEDWKRMSAAGELKEKLDRDRSVKNLHRYALAELALQKVPQAIELLMEASKKEPANAGILSDLAAAQIANGLIAEGAENAARALEHDPTLAPAAFNRALGLEALSNRPAAIEAWGKYLQLDGTSRWAVEAREHLDRLRAPRASDRSRDLP